METPVAVANYYIKKAMDEGVEMTPMKLLKLVYIANGWHLALSDGEPLVGESAEAWKYGPVIPSVYHGFKIWGKGNITQLKQFPILQIDGTYAQSYPLPTNEELTPFFDKIWDMYKRFDGLQLSAMTHEVGTPWDTTYKTRGENAIIPNDLITKHYKSKLVRPQVAQ